MHIISLIIALISGAVGGNIAGAATKNKNFGILGNSIIGLLGGGATNIILQLLGILQASTAKGEGFSIGSLLGNIGSSGVVGAIVLLVISAIKGSTGKPKQD